jgi:hypothetical protein
MKTPIARSPAALLLMALAGCAALSNAPPPSPQPATAVVQSVEQGGRFIALVGPRLQHAEPFLGVPGTNFFLLRSWIDTRDGKIAHQLYVEDSYFGAKRNWEAARDAQGQKLRFVPISMNEITCDNGTCSYAEEFAAALPEALLRASPQGLAVSFTARSGAQQTMIVPGDLIAKQLAAVAEARASLPAAAAAPPASPPPGNPPR